MNNKIKMWMLIGVASLASIILGIVVIFSFFTSIISSDTTDGVVTENMKYANEYIKVSSKYITSKKGYIPLSRLVYFYENSDYTMDEIYHDNLSQDMKQMKPISEVCELEKYQLLEICEEEIIYESGQINEYQLKPFASPIDYSKTIVTSFFMEERYVFDKYSVHHGWDFAAPAMTEVYAVCDGNIKNVSFQHFANVTDTSSSLGNYIVLECIVNENIYDVYYAHLYPNSNKVKIGDKVLSGQVLAKVGTTGYSTGNHLHYAVMKNNKYVDGMSLIDFN